MSASTRILAEKEHHDTQALERRGFFAQHPEQLLVNDESYLGHETWMRPAFKLLGDVRGRHVLDLGSGHGMASVVLARRGARVTALEVSPLYLQEALLRAACNGLGGRITAVHGSGEQLPFADAVFDCVWGNAILHHLDLSRAGLEIHRVLRPGGRAIFCEPWGGNPVLEWARRRLPYPEKSRSVAEQPLRQRDLKFLAAVFPNLTVAPFQLLGMTRRLWPQSPFLGAFDRMDRALFRHWRGLRGWCRYIVLCLTR